MATNQTGDFSQGSVPKTILRLAIPIILAELVHVAYNIVDRAFIGRIPDTGTLALTGVGVAFPLISLILAFANLFGIGGASLSSIARGEGDNEKAREIQETSFTMLLIVGAAITIIMFFASPLLLSLMGGDEQTLPYAISYFRIYVLGTIPVLISLGMNPFINGQGFAKIGMWTVLIGAILNIILDPIFIYTFGMGSPGAALATVISQIVSAAWVILFLIGKNPIVPIRQLRMIKTHAKNIIKLGITGFAFKATNSVVQAVTNIVLKSWGGAASSLYIGAMTIINSVREIAMCPLNGISTAAMPVMSYNHGAGQPKRVSKAIGTLLATAMAIDVVLWSILMLAPQWFYGIFTEDAALIEVGARCCRIYFMFFPMMTLQLTGQNTFVALNYPKYSLFFSMFRKIIIVVPLTLLLPYTKIGVMAPFWAENISQVVGSMACFLTMYFVIWRKLRAMPVEDIKE